MTVIEKIASLELEASEFGFQWEKAEQIIEQIHSECLEVMEQLRAKEKDKNLLQEEIGDLMHATFSLCCFCNLDPQETLENSVDKFARRLEAVKKIATENHLLTLEGKNFNELMAIWKQAKHRVG